MCRHVTNPLEHHSVCVPQGFIIKLLLLGLLLMQVLPPGERRQTLLFSATMTQALIKLQQKALHDAYVYQVREGHAQGLQFAVHCTN